MRSTYFVLVDIIYAAEWVSVVTELKPPPAMRELWLRVTNVYGAKPASNFMFSTRYGVRKPYSTPFCTLSADIMVLKKQVRSSFTFDSVAGELKFLELAESP